MGTEKNKKRKKCKTYITKLHKTLLEKSRGKAKNWFSVKLLKEQSRFQTEQSCLPTLRARWHKSKLLQLEERVEPMSFLPTWKGKTSFQRSKVCLVGEKQQSHTPDMLISNLTLESYDSVIIVSFESSKRCFRQLQSSRANHEISDDISSLEIRGVIVTKMKTSFPGSSLYL